MPATHDYAAWFVLRFVAGGASALIFMFAVSAMLSRLPDVPHLVGASAIWVALGRRWSRPSLLLAALISK